MGAADIQNGQVVQTVSQHLTKYVYACSVELDVLPALLVVIWMFFYMGGRVAKRGHESQEVIVPSTYFLCTSKE